MATDSEDDFVAASVGSRRRKSSRPRKATLKQKLLDESGSSDDDFVPIPRKKKAAEKKKEGAADCKTTSQRLSRDEKLFNQDLKKALVESKSLSGQQDLSAVSISSPQGSLSDSESEKASDYLPEDNSDSDVDFEPSLSSPPPKSTKTSAKQNSKAKAPTRTAQKRKKQKASSDIASPKEHQLSNNCKPLVRVQAVETSSLPGSKPAVSGSRKAAVCPAPGPRTAVVKAARTTTTPTTTGGGGERPSTHAVGVKRAKWVPPGKAVDAKTAGSGGSIHGSPVDRRAMGAPGIRVGLSRRAPIKPLHQTPLKIKNT